MPYMIAVSLEMSDEPFLFQIFSRIFFPITLLPHFHPLPASLYPSAFAPLWKHPTKVEANFASTYSKRHGFTATHSFLF